MNALRHIAPRLIVTGVILAALAWALASARTLEAAYPGLAPGARQVQQGLDYLNVDPNTPLDTESALDHFNAVLAMPDASGADRLQAAYLSAWCPLALRTPDFDAARVGFERFVADYPEAPFLSDALLSLALVEMQDPADADPRAAVGWLERMLDHDPKGPLAAHAVLLIAGLYAEELADPEQAAAWYEKAYARTGETHHADERLGFLYLAGKYRQRAGDAAGAVHLFRRVLELGESGTGAWTDRALDRLEELGAPVAKDYFPGLDTKAVPMTDYQFAAENPVELAVSFWILDKKGMRAGIEEIIGRYEQRTPKVTVRLVDLPYEGYHDWVQTNILGREIPDIIQIDLHSAIRYGAHQGKLVDMTPYLDQANPYTGVTWSASYYPQFIIGARDSVYRKNWVISWASESTAFFYNKDLFRKAGIVARDAAGQPVLDEDGKAVVAEPRTHAALLAAYEKLREIGVYAEVHNFLPDPAPIIWQGPYLRKQCYDSMIPGLDVFTPDDFPDPLEMAHAMLDGSLDLRDPEVAAPWRMMYDASEYWVPGCTTIDLRQGMDFFARGQAASIFWVSTGLPDFEATCDFEVGVFPFPLAEDSPFYDGPYANDFNLSAFEFAAPKVTRDRGSTAAAVDFMRYFTSPEAQAILCEASNCMAPIRGVPVPDDMEPFVRRTNKRGTHQFNFDPYTIGIVKAPYWVDARDKLWNELGRLLGTIPNYEHYRQQTGGSREDYRQWREARFNAFLENLQKYFLFAYARVVNEYPGDLRREVNRLQHRWVGAFRNRYAPRGEADAEAAATAMLECWRGILDNWALIGRCEDMAGPGGGSGAVQGLSYREQKEIHRLVRMALWLVAAAAALGLTWSGYGRRLVRDWPYLAVLMPTMLLLAVFSYTPAGSAIYHAFFRWNGSDISEFTGLSNFRAMWSDPVLYKAAGIMFVFLVANIVKLIPTVVVSVVLFHLASTRLQYLYRVVFVLPMAIPAMVGMLLWKYFYRMDGGLFNWILLKLHVIPAPVNWLGTEETVVPALLFLGFPWVSTIGVLILLAGLQGITQSVFDAARVDGCGVFRRFWAIELPLVMGQVKLNVILITIGTIQDFWLPLVLTKGGPNHASMLPGLWMYQNAFSYGKMGYAAALGLAMFLVILLFTYANMRLISAGGEGGRQR